MERMDALLTSRASASAEMRRAGRVHPMASVAVFMCWCVRAYREAYRHA
jgi:hypothetical protein